MKPSARACIIFVVGFWAGVGAVFAPMLIRGAIREQNATEKRQADEANALVVDQSRVITLLDPAGKTIGTYPPDDPFFRVLQAELIRGVRIGRDYGAKPEGRALLFEMALLRSPEEPKSIDVQISESSMYINDVSYHFDGQVVLQNIAAAAMKK